MAGISCVLSAGQVKAIAGEDKDNIFELTLPEPVDSAPTGEITIGDVTQQLTFTGAAPVKVEGLGDGRRKLFLEQLPTTKLAGKHGAAFVVSDSICWSTRVLSYNTEGELGNEVYYAILSEPLPLTLPQGEDIYLYLTYYAATLPSVANPIRNCLLRVEYQPIAKIGSLVQTLTYLVAYVYQIFTTGLTIDDVRSYFQGLGAQPNQDAGFEPAIIAGEDALIDYLREQLAEKGLTEDDIPATTSLRQAHRLFAAAHVFMLTNEQLFANLTTQAKNSARAALRRAWLNENQDGILKDEDVGQVGGNRSKDFGFKRAVRKMPWRTRY